MAHPSRLAGENSSIDLPRLVRASVVAIGVIAFASSAMAGPLVGELQMFVSQDVETINSFDVVIGGTLVHTGLITASLDITHPANETILFDFDRMTVRLHTDLLIHAPLLDSLGLPPEPIQIDEVGTIDLIQFLANPGPLIAQIAFSSSSSGVIGSGPLEGFTYSAKESPPPCNPNPVCPGWIVGLVVDGAGRVVSAQTLNEDPLFALSAGILRSPDGLQQIDITGERHGMISSTPAAAPEPTTLVVFGAGVAGLGLMRRRRRGNKAQPIFGLIILKRLGLAAAVSA